MTAPADFPEGIASGLCRCTDALRLEGLGSAGPDGSKQNPGMNSTRPQASTQYIRRAGQRAARKKRPGSLPQNLCADCPDAAFAMEFDALQFSGCRTLPGGSGS